MKYWDEKNLSEIVKYLRAKVKGGDRDKNVYVVPKLITKDMYSENIQ
jgi:hypothetical protein